MKINNNLNKIKVSLKLNFSFLKLLLIKKILYRTFNNDHFNFLLKQERTQIHQYLVKNFSSISISKTFKLFQQNTFLQFQKNFFLLKNFNLIITFLTKKILLFQILLFYKKGFILYKTQVLAALYLFFDLIVDMQTGEGKTLVIVLLTFLILFFKTKNSIHIVTQNNYLAERDSNYFNSIFKDFHFSSSFLLISLSHLEKQQCYKKKIVYGSINEFIFDFIKDQITIQVQERFNLKEQEIVILDEIDNILIDHSTQPFILSASLNETAAVKKKNLVFLKKILLFSKTLLKQEDYIAIKKDWRILLLKKGINKIKKYFKLKKLYLIKNSKLLSLLNNGLIAKEFFKRDRDYIIRQKRVLLINKTIGRIASSSKFNFGIHQAIEAIETVPISNFSSIQNSISTYNFFKRYSFLTGTSGTAKNYYEEFKLLYNKKVIEIPTYFKKRRKNNSPKFFKTLNKKLIYLIYKIAEEKKKKRPILIGTNSIYKSEVLNFILKKYGNFNSILLNAKYEEIESTIIASAGKENSLLITTNIAGRGTDILLGGKPFNKKKTEELNKAGGLLTILFESFNSMSSNDQFHGRSSRRNDKGESLLLISLDDQIFKEFNKNFFYNINFFLKYHGFSFKTINFINSYLLNKILMFQFDKNFLMRNYIIQNNFINNFLRDYLFHFIYKIQTMTNLKTVLKHILKNYLQELFEQNSFFCFSYKKRKRIFKDIFLLFSLSDIKKWKKIYTSSFFFKYKLENFCFDFFFQKIYSLNKQKQTKILQKLKYFFFNLTEIFSFYNELSHFLNSYKEIKNYFYKNLFLIFQIDSIKYFNSLIISFNKQLLKKILVFLTEK